VKTERATPAVKKAPTTKTPYRRLSGGTQGVELTAEKRWQSSQK
tara:strand:+ start:758 stop:889 length:132 start_codon:yes stop_codon:yes gene_type:complete